MRRRICDAKVSAIMKDGVLVDIKEFTELHTHCITVRRGYFAEAQKTSLLLGKCCPEPLSFFERFAILRQEITENNALLLYIAAKGLLHRAALRGFEAM